MRSTILRKFPDAGRLTIVTALAICPAMWSKKSQDIFNLFKITVLCVGVIAATAIYISWSAERRVGPPKARLFWFVGAFILACIVATIFSKSPVVSLLGLYHRYGGLIPFALYAILMVLIVGFFWEKPGQLSWVARGSAVASVALVSYVLIQKAGLDPVSWLDSDGKPPAFPVGTMGNSNFAGGYLGIAFPFIAYIVVSSKKSSYRWAGLGLVIAGVFALFFTQTRGGMVAAAAGLLTMAFVLRDLLPKLLRLSAGAIAIVIVFIAFAVLWHPGSETAYGPLARIQTLRKDTFDIRVYYWSAAFKTFKQHPIAGDGLERYYANYTLNRLPEDGNRLGLQITDKPHNIYLEYAANSGLLGLGTYLMLIGTAGWFGYRRVRDRTEKHRVLLAAFLGVLAGHLAQGVFSIDVPPLAVMAWVAIGGIAAIADPVVIRTREAPTSDAAPLSKSDRRQQRRVARLAARRPARMGVHIPVALVALTLVIIGVRPFRADMYARRAATAEAQNKTEAEVTKIYDKVLKLHPFEPSYLVQAATYQEKLAVKQTEAAAKTRYFEDSLDLFTRALETKPDDVFYLMNLARINTSWAESIDQSRFEQAKKWWKRAVAADPTDYIVRERLALMINSYANKTGRKDLRMEAIEVLRGILEVKPDHAISWINIGKTYQALGNLAEARTSFQKALEIDPKNAEASQLLAALPAP